jgi:hypothetical protein
MKRIAVFALAASCLAGCGDQRPRLECTIHEQGPPAGTLRISAVLADPEPGVEEVRDFAGTIEFADGSRTVSIPAHGMYSVPPTGGPFELYSLGELPDHGGKLNVTVMPTHPVLRRRGTDAVVLRGEQTVENATPAVVQCRTVEPS